MGQAAANDPKARQRRARRRALLEWYRRERRDLPWRRTRDPYAIWVAETMLQQTRVETAETYYTRFLRRFPTARALARAELDEVLELWSGLGYYSRARRLHEAAKRIVTEAKGELPRDPAQLQRLPGIGRYTAGAIASIAFDRPAPVLDGNVARVLARLLDLREPITSARVRSRLWEEAERWAQGPHPGELNQALMELGARVCTPRAPRCEVCPLAEGCCARARGRAALLPHRERRRAPRRLEAVAALLARRGRVLVVRRSPKELLGGLWELPGGERPRTEAPRAALERALRQGIGIRANGLRPVAVLEHTLSHRRVRLHLYRGEAPAGRVRLRGFEGHRWVHPAEIRVLAASALTRRALETALAAAAAPEKTRRRADRVRR